MASKLHHQYVCFLNNNKEVNSVITTKSKGCDELRWKIMRGGENEKNGIWVIKLYECLHGFEIDLPYPDQAVSFTRQRSGPWLEGRRGDQKRSAS